MTVGDEPLDVDGLYVQASITESESACTRNADGEPEVSLNVAGSFRSGVQGEAGKAGGPSGNADAYVGKGIAWDISTDPDTAEDLQDGTLPTPSPVDPTTIPEGTTLTLSECTYEGLDLGVADTGVQASLGDAEGTEVSSAVTRVDDDTLRVTVGDADYIEQAAGLGLGVVNAGVSSRSTNAKAKQVDIDMSTTAGHAAYAAFVQEGKLPASGAGVSAT